MTNRLSSDEDYEIWVLLSQVRDIISKARKNELRPLGITTRQAAALFVIEAIGNEVTATEMSRWLRREHHSVSGLLSRMEKKGLISRSKDSPSKNLARVTLTEKGRQAYYYQSTQRASISNTMGILSQEERQQLSSLLKKLRSEGLQLLAEDLKPPFP